MKSIVHPLMKGKILIFTLLMAGPSFAVTVKKIEVYKSLRRLDLMVKSGRDLKVFKSYDVHLGPSPLGHKVKEGDGKTPEGLYKLNFKNPDSSYHLGLLVSYPNEEDKAHARELGVDPGGAIYVHGMPNNIKKWSWMFPFKPPQEQRELVYEFLNGFDWTQGCIAVTNEEIEEIYKLTPEGTPIELFP